MAEVFVTAVVRAVVSRAELVNALAELEAVGVAFVSLTDIWI
jgi:hypothetical protein